LKADSSCLTTLRKGRNTPVCLPFRALSDRRLDSQKQGTYLILVPKCINTKRKMKAIHIIGQPESGKTTLIADIISELVKQKIKVGSLKHSSHFHELDKPGKDSFIHRKAGASIVSMLNQGMAAIYLPRTEEITPQSLLDKYYTDPDIVLIEGWISGPHEKIEIWRKSLEKPLLFPNISRIRAIVTDDSLDRESKKQAENRKISIFKRNEIIRLVNFIVPERNE
jgi:molybdopterin-guanine dinucleotide biosynthesis adapter protein